MPNIALRKAPPLSGPQCCAYANNVALQYTCTQASTAYSQQRTQYTVHTCAANSSTQASHRGFAFSTQRVRSRKHMHKQKKPEVRYGSCLCLSLCAWPASDLRLHLHLLKQPEKQPASSQGCKPACFSWCSQTRTSCLCCEGSGGNYMPFAYALLLYFSTALRASKPLPKPGAVLASLLHRRRHKHKHRHRRRHRLRHRHNHRHR